MTYPGGSRSRRPGPAKEDVTWPIELARRRCCPRPRAARQVCDGTALQVAGSIPVTFSTWDITGPSGYGFLASLANHGVAEFLLILHRGQ
jgi:hypothetical protein